MASKMPPLEDRSLADEVVAMRLVLDARLNPVHVARRMIQHVLRLSNKGNMEVLVELERAHLAGMERRLPDSWRHARKALVLMVGPERR